MDADVTFTLDSYDVVKEIYPADVDEYDGLLISGSRSSPVPYRHPPDPLSQAHPPTRTSRGSIR